MLEIDIYIDTWMEDGIVVVVQSAAVANIKL
jgi:hypothetical protein